MFFLPYELDGSLFYAYFAYKYEFYAILNSEAYVECVNFALYD